MEYTQKGRVLRFFISSVGRLMGEERNTLRDIIWKQGYFPLAMEGFLGNHAQTSIDVVIKNLEKADVIMFVLGFIYGSKIDKGLQCCNCPIYDICTGKKKKNQKKCSISYTHFEYLYAVKHKIRRYCIIQEDISAVDGLQKRLNALGISSEEQRNYTTDYMNDRELQLKFVEAAKQKWSFFYDSTDPEKGIAERFKEVTTQVLADIERERPDELYGLVEGRKYFDDLRMKNETIETLKKEVESWRAKYDHASEIILKERERESEPITAVTGTCIPFKYDKAANSIITYLINNTAYQSDNEEERPCRLMFPGGHAFMHDNDNSPESVAIAKARSEAGLEVRPIDLYKSFDLFAETDTDSQEAYQFSEQLLVYNPPHYSYRFTQNEAARCFVKYHHEFHYDAVYVCEILEELEEAQCTKKRVRIELPFSDLTFSQIKDYLDEGINQLRYLNDSYGDYIIKMLYEAFRDYKRFLEVDVLCQNN